MVDIVAHAIFNISKIWFCFFRKSGQITNRVKGAEKTKRVSKRATVMQARKPAVDLAALGSEERRVRQRRGGAPPCVARSCGQGGAAAPREGG